MARESSKTYQPNKFPTKENFFSDFLNLPEMIINDIDCSVIAIQSILDRKYLLSEVLCYLKHYFCI